MSDLTAPFDAGVGCDRLQRDGVVCRDRGYHQDAAGRALRDHLLRCELRGEEGPLRVDEVDPHGVIPCGLDKGLRQHDRGCCDTSVYPAVVFDDVLEGACQGVEIGDVGVVVLNLRVREVGLQLAEVFVWFRQDVQDRNVASGFDTCSFQSEADAPAASCYDCDFVF